MSTTFGHHPWTVQELVNGVFSGQVRLPDIQRPFVWSNAKVRDLIDSMYRGYPVGELMFWSNRDEDHSRSIGADEKSQDATMQVVDGQQRLTSLYAVVKGLEVWRDDYSRERIRIAFNPITGRFDVPTAVIERSPEWIPDVVSIFQSPIGARKNYLARLGSDGREITAEEEAAVEVALNRVHSLLSYGFQVVQVNVDVSREEVADIFVRMISEGVNLGSADFILTWMSVFWEDGRTQLENYARNSRFTPLGISQIVGQKISWTPHNPYLALNPGQILRVVVGYGLHRGRLSDAYNRLRGRDPRTREINPEQREAELARLTAGQEQVLKPLHWDEFLKVLERAGFRSSDMITSENTVLYTYILWLMGRIDHKVPIDDLREVMARWFFASQITGRYTTSPETQIQDDISRVDEIKSPSAAAFTDLLNEMIDAAAPPDWWTVSVPDNLVTSSTNAPAYVGYIAALNVLDAEVLLSTLAAKDWINPNRRSVKGLEKHHLFPKSHLKQDLGITAVKKINQVANYALVEWSDNIDISADAPTEYWPRQIIEKNISDTRRIRQEQWHALPQNWTKMEFDDFLRARRRLMAQGDPRGLQTADRSQLPAGPHQGHTTRDSGEASSATLRRTCLQRSSAARHPRSPRHRHRRGDHRRRPSADR